MGRLEPAEVSETEGMSGGRGFPGGWTTGLEKPRWYLGNDE